MSQKQRLQSLLDKFKEWSKDAGDETLDEHIAALETEIQLMSETNDSEDGGGDTPFRKPPVP